ncbi:hypothetical protein ACT3TP_18445, partial [Glutamicibacter sp. AOP38-B1-38]|uniref:hypothetical protein n=1 Tax=Glutamicibacter sp. AOP38-B1-38 TaxID=3457680 RepID=UPI0040336FAC
MSKKSLKGLAALSIAALLIGNANAAVALEAPDSSHKALLNLSKVSSDTNVDVLNTSVEAKATMAQQWDCHVRGLHLVKNVDLESKRKSWPGWRKGIPSAVLKKN